MKNIILVGFMGTGKSAVGRLLARRLKWPFLDLDKKIEKDAGRSIAEIFTAEGEAGFRRLEAKAVQDVVGLQSHVIATGGGVMCDEKNVEALKGSGFLVCLTASPEMILERTAPTLSSRPLLSGGDPRERIQALLALRTPFYAKADATMDTTNRTLQDVAEEILKVANR